MYDTIVIIMLIIMLIITISGEVTIVRLVNNNYTREGIAVAIHTSTEEVIIVDTTCTMSGASMVYRL